MSAAVHPVAVAAIAVAMVSVAAALRPRLLGVDRSPGTPAPQVVPPTWPHVLDHVARAIRSGSGVRTAYQHTLQQLGTPPASPSSPADAAVAAQALEVATALGGPTASVFEAAAALLREREVARAQAVAHAAQARLSARLLTAVPLLFAGWSALTSASFRAALFSPVGAVSAVAGAVLNLAGWWWMRRIVEGATR